MGTFAAQAFTIPATQDVLLYERAESGRLVRLSCNGRSYLEECEGGRVLDELATISEVMLPSGLLRRVRAAGQTWTEEYLWDATGRLARVDGVDVHRDDHHRVTACHDREGGDTGGCDWLYAYADDHLAVIAGPHEVRHLTRGADGRPVRSREGARLVQIAYDSAGSRRDVPHVPENWHRDELGRLWTVTGHDGVIRTTYLWDGFACLGRIDGPPGAPLAAVYSLDPSCTPVRIITRTEVRRVPRDAFGEGLLAHPGTPGLYGGSVHEGFVYLVARVVDPRTGAFNAPDPWHGLEDDPRRTEGYRGPLMVENAAAGPYTVCQNDPVGRADPTGEVSFLLILSDLTWSLQNNLLGWLGLDAVINFWGSLIGSLVQLIAGGSDRSLIGRFFSGEGLSSSDRLGSFGFRRDGLVTFKNPSRAWTYQHTVWSVPEEFEDLTAARVFDPKGEFRPTLYGTVLRTVPERGAPFMLRGARNIAAGTRRLDWTRAGGEAEPVIPGSPVPHFPAGGLHFDLNPQALLNCPQNCTVTELGPMAALGMGTIEDRVVIVVPATGLGLNTDNLVLLTDARGGVVVSRVLAATQEDQTTRVRLGTAVANAGVGPTGVRLRGLGASSSTESLSAVTPTPSPMPGNSHLQAVGTSAPYARGDVLRLIQGGAQVGAAIIRRLEARVQFDAPLPNTLTPPLVVTMAQPSGSPNPATLTSDGQILDFPTGQPIPAVGDTIALTRGPDEIAVAVTASPADRQRRLDRSVAALGAAGDAATWRPLVRGMELGRRADPSEADPVMTYEPSVVRTAPSSGFVRVEASDGTPTVRRVTGLTYDALVLSSALPGNTGASYDVDRLPIRPPDHANLSITQLQTLALNPSVPLDGVALQLHQFPGSGITAGPVPGPVPAATITGTVASVTLPAGGTSTQPTPSQLVVLNQLGNDEPAFVTRVRLTITFDRSLRLSASGLQVVPLVVGSPAYQAERRDVLLVTVRPEVAGTGRVQMPRFGVGELVEANWTGATRSRQYRVTAVEGTTLTLTGDAGLPASTPDLTITRLVPGDPKTGGSRAGIEGVPVNVATDDTTRQVRFQVWRPGTLVPTTPSAVVQVGIIDGATVHPAVVDGSALRPLEIEFAAAPGLSGPGVNITVPSLTGTGYAASFTQEEAAVVIRDDPPPLPASTTNLVVAVPFHETDRRANGELSPGTVLVPEDPENAELDRRESLTDHELRHTLQSAMWGPLLLSWFPLAALEGLLELKTDIELPEFSAYVGGTIEEEGANRFLRIPDPQGIDFQPSDNVQIAFAGTVQTVPLRQRQDSNRFRIDAALNIPTGTVQVRRQTPSNVWRDVPFDVLQTLTHGGMLNLLAGSVYGGLMFGLAKFGYAVFRIIVGPGATYPATVEDEGRRLRLGNETGRTDLRGASRIIVQNPPGNSTFVRSVAGNVANGVIPLASAVELRGEVRVALYSTHTPDSHWDWHDYFPATVPDPARPAAIRVEAVDGRRLSLSRFDRVTLTAGTVSKRTGVTAVAADGTVELESSPRELGIQGEFRIAKVDENDPMGNADSWVMKRLGMGWLRWAFDPYGQLHFRSQPRPDSFWGVVARIARYVFGSQSWSAIVPGWFVWDNALKQAGSNPKGHLSQMEQDASEESGDLYSPVGRLRGSVSVVGDVARYWYFLNSREGTVVMGDRQDAPGVHIGDGPRVVPSLDTAGGGTAEPNLGARVAPAVTDPGLDVPDVFFSKANVNPNGANAANPQGFQPALRGWIPTSPVLERTSGVYAAFSRPGIHRITVVNGINGAAEGREAQTEGKQTLFFNVNVQDVGVAVAGLSVARGGTITLVQTQRAAVSVVPNADRRYAVRLTRPTTGDVLRTDDDLVIVAQTNNGTEPVEVSRVYRHDVTSDAFDSGGLVQHGLHLPTDVHIPVRDFNIEVVNTLPIRSSISIDPASIVTTRLPGQEAFVLVPATTMLPLRLASPTGASASSLTIGVETVPEAFRAFVGDGGIFKLTFPTNDPPEEPTNLIFQVDVGASGNSATLEAQVQLVPHFRLVPQGSGTNFQVARGATITLTCTDAVNAGAIVVAPSAGVTTAVAGPDITITVETGAVPGPRRILVDDAANPLRKARRTIEIV